MTCTCALMTVRHREGQFNTVVYEEEDIYRGQDCRNVILMNRADIDRLGPARSIVPRDGAQRHHGYLSGIHVRAFDLRGLSSTHSCTSRKRNCTGADD